MNYGRSNHAFVEINGVLLAIGGWDGEKAMNQVEGFDLATEHWEVMPRLHEPRHSLSACAMNDKVIYAIGGSSAINYGSSSNTIEKLDFGMLDYEEALKWEMIYLFGDFCSSKRSQLGSFAIDDQKIMIFGGFLDTDLTNMCFVIDVQTFEISRMDCYLSKNKKFIKFKDFIVQVGQQYVYAIDDEGEIHQYSNKLNEWQIVETKDEKQI
jgi:hypothetical protein